MSLTLIPLNKAPAPPTNGSPESAQPRLPFDYEPLPTHPLPVPVLVIQLQDDLARSRLREAFWISVVVHLLLIVAVVAAPKYLPMHRLVAVKSAEDLLREREATFIALPPDEQQVTARPNAKYLSDKDRIASSRAPQIDRKTLDELRDARRPGPPQPPGTPARPPAPAVAQAQPQQGPQAGQPSPSPAQSKPSPSETAQLRTPPLSPKQAFGGAMSPGSAIEQATRAAAGTRGYGGAAGDYGTAFPTGGGIKSNMDILSDTMGFDFSPYLARIRHIIQDHWTAGIPVPLSCTSSVTNPSRCLKRIIALALRECFSTFARLSCTTRNSASSMSSGSRPKSFGASSSTTSRLRAHKPFA